MKPRASKYACTQKCMYTFSQSFNLSLLLLNITLLSLLSSCSRETAYWNKVNQINSIDAYNSYLNYYPTGRYVQEAKDKIEELIWNNIKRENTLEGYKNYLSTYPEGKYIKEANERIETLIWQIAEKENTEAKYHDYLEKYPSGKYSSLAKERIENLVWKKTKEEDTKSAYQRYLSLYPSGKYVEVSKEMLAKKSIQLQTKQTVDNVLKDYELPYELWISQILKYVQLETIDGSVWELEIRGRPLGAQYPQGFLYTGAEVNVHIAFSNKSKKILATQFRRLDPPPTIPLQYLPDSLPMSPADAPCTELAEKALKIAVLNIVHQLEGTSPIINVTKDTLPTNRECAFYLLASVGKQDLTPLFCNGLEDHYLEVRKISAYALANSRDPNSIDCLIRSLSEVNLEIKKTIITTLGNLKTQKAVEPLWNLFAEERNTEIQNCIITALQKIDPKWNQSPFVQEKINILVDRLIDKDPQVRNDAMALLNLINPQWRKSEYINQKIPELVNLLHSHDPTTRHLTINLLSQIKSPQTIGPLMNLLIDPDPQIRKNALEALSKIDARWYKTNYAQSKIPLLVTALLNPDPQINDLALWTLNRIHPRWSQRRDVRPRLSLFIDALLNDNPNIVKSAKKSLPYLDYRWFDTPEVKNRLKDFIDALQQGNVEKKLTALYVIGETRDKQNIPYLIDKVLDENPLIRSEAVRALSKIDPKWHRNEEAKKKIPDFINALQHEKPEIRKSALENLVKIAGLNFGSDYNKWKNWWEKQITESKNKK